MSHTQGKLIVKGGYCIYADEGKTPVADACINAISDPSEANARRLVACWNASIGIPTAELEAAADGRLLNIFEGLISERDELLAALKVARLWHQGDKWRDDCMIELRAAWEAHRDALDAAIARAEKGGV